MAGDHVEQSGTVKAAKDIAFGGVGLSVRPVANASEFSILF